MWSFLPSRSAISATSRVQPITTVSPVAAGGPRRRSSCWGICCSAGGVRAGSELCEQALAGDTSPQQRLAEKGLESSSRPDKSCFSAVPGHKYRARSREGPRRTALPCADSGTPARADRPAASRKLLRASIIGQEQSGQLQFSAVLSLASQSHSVRVLRESKIEALRTAEHRHT